MKKSDQKNVRANNSMGATVIPNGTMLLQKYGSSRPILVPTKHLSNI